MPKYILRRPGRPPVESPYGSVDDILREPIAGRPPEHLSHTGASAELAIREMGARGWTDETIARHLRVRSPDRIARAREWLGCAQAASPERKSDAELAADFQHFVDDEPPQAA